MSAVVVGTDGRPILIVEADDYLANRCAFQGRPTITDLSAGGDDIVPSAIIFAPRETVDRFGEASAQANVAAMLFGVAAKVIGFGIVDKGILLRFEQPVPAPQMLMLAGEGNRPAVVRTLNRDQWLPKAAA